MPIFKISSQNGCLFSSGAYFHGVLINTCNFLAACSCVGRLAVIYFMPRCSFSALCPVFIALFNVTMYIWSRVQRVKMGAYIHGVLIYLYGYQFYCISSLP